MERSGIQDRYLHSRVLAFRTCYPAGVIERDAETAADLGEDELRRVYPLRGRQGFTL